MTWGRSCFINLQPPTKNYREGQMGYYHHLPIYLKAYILYTIIIYFNEIYIWINIIKSILFIFLAGVKGAQERKLRQITEWARAFLLSVQVITNRHFREFIMIISQTVLFLGTYNISSCNNSPNWGTCLEENTS